MRLLPSLRQKKRYVVVEAQSAAKFSYTDLAEGITYALQQFWGELGLAKASPLFLPEKFNPSRQRVMLKVNNPFVDEFKAALTLSKKIKNTPVILRSIVASGTLKKASSYI